MKWKPKESSVSYTYIRKKKQKTDFKLERVDKEGHYVTIKLSIHQKDTIIINIYAPNIRVPKYIKQILQI